VAEHLYRVRNPSGAEFGPASEDEVCALIGAGSIALDAVASDGTDAYVPITQFGIFAKAFEARFGILGAAKHTSDSTPHSVNPFEEKTVQDVPRPSLDVTEEDSVPKTLPSLAGAESSDPDRTPIALASVRVDIPAASTVVEDTPPSADLEPRTPITQDSMAAIVEEVSATVPESPDRSSSTTEPEHEGLDAKKRAMLALAGWGLITGVLFGAGVAAHLGDAEAHLSPGSVLFYLRILSLSGAGLALARIARLDPIDGSHFAIRPVWALIAISAGIFGGLLGPLWPIEGALAVALSMRFLHALSEEVFFRGFLERALMDALPSYASRALVSAGLFGVYQLSYSALWLERSALESVLWSLALAILAGLPLSVLYQRTKSFLPSAFAHLALNLLGVLMSAAQN
jgi:membrane protease YdiL (CAAX protease family)